MKTKKALGPLAVLNLGDCNRTADETTKKALGPLAPQIRPPTTADEDTKKALGPLAVAA